MHNRCLSWIVYNVNGSQWRSLPVLKELPLESISRMFEIASQMTSVVTTYAKSELKKYRDAGKAQLLSAFYCSHGSYFDSCPTCRSLSNALHFNTLNAAMRTGQM